MDTQKLIIIISWVLLAQGTRATGFPHEGSGPVGKINTHDIVSVTFDVEPENVKITDQEAEAEAEPSNTDLNTDLANDEDEGHYFNSEVEPSSADAEVNSDNGAEKAESTRFDTYSELALPLEVHPAEYKASIDHKRNAKGHNSVPSVSQERTTRNSKPKSERTGRTLSQPIPSPQKKLSNNQSDSIWNQIKTAANNLNVPHCPTFDDFFAGSKNTWQGLKDGGIGEDVHVLIDSAASAFHGATNCMQRLFKDLKTAVSGTSNKFKDGLKVTTTKQKKPTVVTADVAVAKKKPTVVRAADALVTHEPAATAPKSGLSKKEIQVSVPVPENTPALGDASAYDEYALDY